MNHVRTATLSFPTGADATLTCEGTRGDLQVEGADSDQITVVVTLRLDAEDPHAADEALQRTMDAIRHDGAAVAVRAPTLAATGRFRFGPFNLTIQDQPQIDYLITVPRRSACRIANRRGRVEVADIAGPVEITQRSGRAAVRQIEGAVRVETHSGRVECAEVGGDVAVSAHSGRVNVQRVQGDVRISSHSGAVTVEEAGALTVQTASGRVNVNGVKGESRITTTSGGITLNRPGGAVRLRSTSGSIRYDGAVRAPLEVETTSGSVRLDVDPDYPFFIDATTISGSLHSDLPPRPGAPPTEDAPVATIRTVSGSVRLGQGRCLW